jgi:pSer/pThr/pTyr-binding forkhead associated (FHA) protein
MTATHRQPNAALIISRGPGTGQQFDVTESAVTVGRRESCDIQVDNPEVSRQHAYITWNGTRYVVEDLDSANGTFVNEERISGPHILENGDLLRLGQQVELAFQVVAQVPSDERLTMMPGAAAPPGGKPVEPVPAKGKGFPWVVVGLGALVFLCLCLALAAGAYWFLQVG